jgi:steroid delta-isomerase-like uncharacterized protein
MPLGASAPPRPKDIVRRFFDEIWNQRRLERFDAYVSEDFVTSGPTGALSRGRDALRSFTEGFLDAVPDYRIQLDDLVEEGDRVAVRWVCRGTHRGTLMGVAPTGRSFSLSGISIYRVRDGRLAEVWRERDLPGMWRQLLPELGLDPNGIPENAKAAASAHPART